MHLRTPLNALALVLVAAVAPRLAAQDVTVTSLEWAEPDDAPDQLPVENHPLRVKFPSDLRNTPGPGYVIVGVFTDEKGGRTATQTVATLPAYSEAALADYDGWKLKPGRRSGQAVNTYTRCAVIFNPASAAVGKPDATPRVLAVKEVRIPVSKAEEEESYRSLDPVWATVSLDAAGRPIGLRDAPSALTARLEEAVQAWRFAPARKAGQPVAADLRVPFVLLRDDGERLSGKQTLPRVIARVHAFYPMSMGRSGLRGDVLVGFVVDREGRVTNAYVIRSLNPAFDESALKAVRQWKFEPGRIGGAPVNTHMQLSIAFRLDDTPEGGDPVLSIERRAKQSNLPPELRYDIAPKPRGTVRPVYPYALLRDGVKGKAKVWFLIGETGRIISAGVTTATRPEFGAAAIAMIEQWEFEPALKDGRPTRSLFAYEQNFSTYEHSRETDEVDDLLALERKHPERIVGAGILDAGLKPISSRPPVFPVTLDEKVTQGEAMVEVLVNEKGQAFLPRVVSASDPAFGWAAAQAASMWRFDPPKLKGKPVVTRVRIPFGFHLKFDAPVEQKK